jgi:TRAP-type C4-dicarboxylate transport system permease small subunit
VSADSSQDKPTVDGVIVRAGNWLAWLFFVGFVITVYEVFMRYVFKSPTAWVHELTTTLCAICFAYGGAYVMARDEHMRVSTLADRLPNWAQRAAQFLGIACGMVYLLGLGWGAWLQALDAVWRFEGSQWIPEPMPGPPGWPLPALIKAVVAAFTLLFLCVLLVVVWRKRGSSNS